MLKEGPKLNTHYISSFPSDLPLLLWHGTADKVRTPHLPGDIMLLEAESLLWTQVTSYEESKKFVELCPSTDKTFKVCSPQAEARSLVCHNNVLTCLNLCTELGRLVPRMFQ